MSNTAELMAYVSYANTRRALNVVKENNSEENAIISIYTIYYFSFHKQHGVLHFPWKNIREKKRKFYMFISFSDVLPDSIFLP